MLKIWQGYYTNGDNTIRKPDGYFDMAFDKKNFLTDFSRRLIEDCGGAKVLAENVFEHKWRGCHSADKLATGVKNILLAKYNPEVIVDLVYCGDNCIPYLIEASKEQDILVSSSRLVDFFDYNMYGEAIESIYVMNDDTLYTQETDLDYMGTWIYEYDWNEDTPEGLILHREYWKPLEQRVWGFPELKNPNKYIKIITDDISK